MSIQCSNFVKTLIMKKNDLTLFLKSLKEQNSKIYDIVEILEYISWNHIILKTPYGNCKGHARSILKWEKIPIKSAINQTEFWINRNKELRKDFSDIDYSLVKYVNNKEKIILKCKIHNLTYEQAPNHHIEGGQGCPKCMTQTVRYTDNTIITNKTFLENIKGCLYVIRLKSKYENFYKVGICSKHRFEYRMKDMKKYYEVSVLFIENLDIVEAYKLEQKFLKEFNNYKYIPLIKFKGYTECLTTNPIEWYYNK